MHKYFKKCWFIPFVTIILLLVLFSDGCGTANPNTTSNEQYSIELVDTINLSTLDEQQREMWLKIVKSNISVREHAGWQVNLVQSDDVMTLQTTRTFSPSETSDISFDSGSKMTKDTRFYLNDNLFFKDYKFEITLIGHMPIDNPLNLDPFNSIFSNYWAITIPGNIVYSNADRIEGNTAIWNYVYSSYLYDHYMTVTTRSIKLQIIPGLSIGLAAIILIIFFIFRYFRRKTSNESQH